MSWCSWSSGLGSLLAAGSCLLGACTTSTGVDAQLDPPPVDLLVLSPAWQEPAAVSRQIEGVRSALRAAGPKWAAIHVEARSIDTEGSQGTSQAGAALREGRPRVVLATTMLVAGIVQSVDQTIPIIFSGSADPVHSCLVDSIGHPGRNASGYAANVAIEAKMVEVARDAFPSAKRLTVLVDGNVDGGGFECAAQGLRAEAVQVEARGCIAGQVDDPAALSGAIDARAYLAAAKQYRLGMALIRVCNWHDVRTFASAWVGGRDEVVLVPNRLLFLKRPAEAAAVFAQHRVPVVYEGLGYADAGGLLAVGPRKSRWPLQAATEMAMLVLTGAVVGDMPVRVPSSVDVWVHVGTAKSTGLLPSMDVLQRADALLR